MHIDLTPDQRALQAELRRYFASLMTPARRAQLTGGEAGGEAYRDLVRQLGKDGWLGVGWPTAYGGQGRTPMEQYLFYDEANRAGVPLPLVTLNTVGPTLMQFGSEDQKQAFLPKILSGELHFAIGYSEPGAGTDLASLRTRAVRDGDEYVINGQKTFTTGGHDADWVWLACRTDPDAPKHKGISIILVPTDVAGFKHTPIWVLGGGHTNATYYEDVRVPVGNRVGNENEGWKLITRQLNHERVALGPAGRLERHLDAVRRWAQETRLADGRRVADQPWVQMTLARVYAVCDALKLANWRVASDLAAGGLNPADASSMKVLGTQGQVECLRLLLEVLGPAGYLAGDTPEAVLRGQLEQAYRQAPVGTFGGGVNEVQREIIQMAGLGMPRAPR
ncbi:MAG TPA: acyl-CoA dehydrogenase family protein [Acidimicrobiia bacterium]|nr:acyl-CoA dehydrogenase family protein [Acidimicrobiia bacterium]